MLCVCLHPQNPKDNVQSPFPPSAMWVLGPEVKCEASLMASVFTGQGILCPAPKLPPSSTFEDSVLCSPGWSGTYSVAETGLDPPVPSPRCWNYLQASATVFSPYIVLNLKKDKSALGILTANMPFSWSKKETKGKKKERKDRTERTCAIL